MYQDIDHQLAQFQLQHLDSNIKSIGESIFKNMEDSEGSIFNKDWWYGRIMEWSMKNEHFKTQMFRFVDVLPYLNTSQDVAKHLKEYFAESENELPSIFNFGVGMGSLAPGLLAGAVKKNVVQMAKMFITGETPQDALPLIKKSRANKICCTIDLLGEATLSEKEAIDYQRRYRELLEWVSRDSESWTEVEQIDTDESGRIPKVNISVKLTSLYSQIKDADWEPTKKILKERMRPLFKLAMERFVFINIDMEQYAHKNLTLEVFKELLIEPEFRNYPHFGIVVQAYLRDSHADTLDLVQFAKSRSTPFTVRLVKGAYWDYEVIHAQQKNWAIPVYTNKKESDLNYERLSNVLLKNFPHIRVAFGSHNVRSIASAIATAQSLNLNPKSFEIQMLYGMADPIKKALVKAGYRVREYATVGELIPGMAYLVRRLLENTSNESFLRSKFADNVSTDHLLKNPGENIVLSSPQPQKHNFENSPPADFAIHSDRQKMIFALQEWNKKLGKNYPIIINGKEYKSDQIFSRVNPSHPQQVVGNIHMASRKEAQMAIDVARNSFKNWTNTAVEKRAELLEKLAALMDRDRFSLAALQVLEVGKPWDEADGDVAEAIDFCRYYAMDMRRLAKPARVGHAPGEVSNYIYHPRGVVGVIAPWNFPLAILTGMVGAALVAGNTVIMKPAEQSSVTAYELMRLIKEAGFPDDVVSYLPGYGEDIGDYIVNSAQVDMIAFTGSKQVGLQIIKAAGIVHPQQQNVKKCIIEMGGKNAIIIDTDADLDEAVQGVLYSAFGFQGQKCSACSRVIVLESIYERFLERFVEAVKSITVGPSENPKSFMGPVVDQEAQQRLLDVIQEAKQKHKLIFEGTVPTEGFFVPPTVFADVNGTDKLAQDEFFGPVLAIIKTTSMDEALKIANGTQYALTGGAYSRSPAHIEKIKNEFLVGNLYINRGITGAMVDRHPFGGFKMSGIGSKTGGPDYLLQFLEPRVVTENTLRRGFAPQEE